jgi:hypothetical protein
VLALYEGPHPPVLKTRGHPTRTGHREPAMSTIHTQPSTEPTTKTTVADVELAVGPAGWGGWREFTDAAARREAIAADLAADLGVGRAFDSIDTDC